MDTPSLVNLPVEIVLLIAEHLDECKEVLHLMQVFLVSKVPNSQTTRRFREIMICIDYRNMARCGRHEHAQGRLRPWCWAILSGDVQLARFALSEGPAAYHMIERLEREMMRQLALDQFYYQYHHTGPLPPPPPDDVLFSSILSDSLPPPPSLVDPNVRVKIPAAALGQNATGLGEIYDPTPAMLAVLSDRLDMLKMVLEELPSYNAMSGCDVDQWRRVHLTFDDRAVLMSALRLAVYLGRFFMVQMLVEAGASTACWSREAAEQAHGPVGLRALGESCIPGASIFAPVFGWGMDKNEVSEHLRSERLAILRYFVDMGRPVDEMDVRPPRMTGEWLCSTNRLPKQFTPLWYCIWALDLDLVPTALFLIRQGARWSPWTAWAEAPWGRGRIRPPGKPPQRKVSPLEWVVRGGPCSSCQWHKREPDPAKLEIEQTLFKAMMEEGIEPPTTTDELQSALEVVIFAHSTRGFRDHPLLTSLCEERVQYLVLKGARVDQLSRPFTKTLKELSQHWDTDPFAVSES